MQPAFVYSTWMYRFAVKVRLYPDALLCADGQLVTVQIALQVAMDGASFAKLCRDSGLLGGKLNTTSVDIAFSKAKAKVRCSTAGIIWNTTCLLVIPGVKLSPLHTAGEIPDVQRYLLPTDVGSTFVLKLCVKAA